MTIDKTTKHLFTHPAKRRAWVRYQLTLRGLNMADIARGAGVTRSCLYQAFCKTYPRMEKVIADAVGLQPHVLWPERYDTDGLPLYRMGRPKKSITNDSTLRAGRNVQRVGANRHQEAA